VLPVPVQDTVLAGWAVKVHRLDVADVCEAWDESTLTRGRVANLEASVREGEEEEAVAGGVELEPVVVEPKNGAAALEYWQAALGSVCAVEREEEARRLAPVVAEEEICGRGEAVPRATDRTAADYVLGW
jgi:hypothetical protein